MPKYVLLLWLLKAIWLAFVFAFGACIGSLINVIVYRMPRGINIVTPPSRCPSCNTRLTWRENIPVLGWILLRGRCRFCRAPISPEYPIVEAAVGLLFALFYALYYLIPPDATFLGIHWGAIRPEWAAYPNPPDQTWPAFVVILLLLGSLSAMTIVDAKTYTIPLSLTWFPAIAALLIHTGHAIWLGPNGLRRPAPGWLWTIPTPGSGPEVWRTMLMSLGAVMGLGISVGLVHFGLLRRSFADYDEWEKAHHPNPPTENPLGPAAPDVIVPTTSLASYPEPAGPAATSSPADAWIQYPHARREMVFEILFLAPCLALAMLGWHAAGWWLVGGPPPPLWGRVLGGVLLGYLVGGGVVWAVRILGSLAFGKEAMGLGDVHLMAAVGACLGWIDASLAFFLAAFVGLGWAIISRVFSGVLRRAMPYGPFLAVATVLVLLTKPVIEVFLSRLLPAAGPINIP